MLRGCFIYSQSHHRHQDTGGGTIDLNLRCNIAVIDHVM